VQNFHTDGARLGHVWPRPSHRDQSKGQLRKCSTPHVIARPEREDVFSGLSCHHVVTQGTGIWPSRSRAMPHGRDPQAVTDLQIGSTQLRNGDGAATLRLAPRRRGRASLHRKEPRDRTRAPRSPGGMLPAPLCDGKCICWFAQVQCEVCLGSVDVASQVLDTTRPRETASLLEMHGGRTLAACIVCHPSSHSGQRRCYREHVPAACQEARTDMSHIHGTRAWPKTRDHRGSSERYPVIRVRQTGGRGQAPGRADVVLCEAHLVAVLVGGTVGNPVGLSKCRGAGRVDGLIGAWPARRRWRRSARAVPGHGSFPGLGW
jgi:hypothetical protein